MAVAPGTAPVRYRFGPFLLSPARRQLSVGSSDVKLIPRYFDLLQLLVEHRDRAVHRQEIFDRVWADVIVSDGALSQAIRTLRRALRDDPREPVYIRTVSRHGYQFIYQDVQEEPDAAPPRDPAPQLPTVIAVPPPDPPSSAVADLVDRLLGAHAGRQVSDEERRDAAEQLHALGTSRAVQALRGRDGEAEALAILRDSRWDVAGAGPVPLLGTRDRVGAVDALVRLRLRRAARLVSSRWASASVGGACAGVLAGLAGGIAMLVVPESQSSWSTVIALALVGATAGAFGAAGIGAGLAAAEALARSQRALGLIGCGALGGACSGAVAHVIARSVLASLFGQEAAAVGGAFEGVVLGASAGLGYAAATTRLPGGGMATPHGGSRARAALTTGACCAIAGAGLALDDGRLVAASLDVVANHFAGSSVGLAPLARLLGEQDLRPITRTLVSAFEGLVFGAGLVAGLTRRPRLHD